MRILRPSLLVTVVLAAAVLGACTQPPKAPTPDGPVGVMRITVATPKNDTGQDLVVDDRGLFAGLLEEKRSTVPEILKKDLQEVLTLRGFKVLTGPGAGIAEMKINLNKWEPYVADYSTVSVDLVATLVDANGRDLWTVTRTNWQVPVDEPRTALNASLSASLYVARSLIENWQPAGKSAKTD
jgi:hypothetical protein